MKTLRNLNALLSLRINIHEELPRHLKQWNVANGKATFTIPSEFEFDVTILDEDASAPFYFQDIRFLFSPTPEIPDSQVRVILEDKANEVLKISGLNGCYDLLHDFTLTHKISTLRRQALEMTRGVWVDSIRIEMVHRSLIVQYWTGLPSKSWVEIGVMSNKSKKRTWRGLEPPQLGLRWTRNGQVVPDAIFDFDWTTLSMETMLKQVIARHTAHVLGSIREALPNSPGGASLKKLDLTTSHLEPSDCALQTQVHGQASPITLVQESVTGRLVLQPPSPLAERAEADLNSQQRPEKNAEALLARFCARDMQLHTEHQAELLGWRTLRNLRLDNATTAFPQAVTLMSVFRGPKWESSTWTMAATYSLTGESWWAVEL